MTKHELINQIRTKSSFLCVGLDPDLNKIPKHLLKEEDPIFAFNKAIIDATSDYCVAYKPNTAFYECYGVKGWESLEKTINYIPKNCFIIADAKRGDIGNTSTYYAKTFFETLPCDAVTVAPYMGKDSVSPFLQFDGKWVVLLALTSNDGSQDFQVLQTGERQLFEAVLLKASQWGSPENLMFVVGATRSSDIAKIRKLVPENFFLVPGVGAQGGSLEEVVKYGANRSCGLLVNSSRAIIYAGNGLDFAEKARLEAQKIQAEMAEFIAKENWDLV
jgi:orotidine-5'-phosphate decarboxylase